MFLFRKPYLIKLLQAAATPADIVVFAPPERSRVFFLLHSAFSAQREVRKRTGESGGDALLPLALQVCQIHEESAVRIRHRSGYNFLSGFVERMWEEDKASFRSGLSIPDCFLRRRKRDSAKLLLWRLFSPFLAKGKRDLFSLKVPSSSSSLRSFSFMPPHDSELHRE